MRLRSRPLMTTIAAIAAGLSLALGACADGGEEVTARSTPAGVVATNHASRAATYLVVDPHVLALANLVDCSQASAGCPRIEPGETVTIPWSLVMGDESGPRTYEMWW